jgi:hypothetical protein
MSILARIDTQKALRGCIAAGLVVGLIYITFLFLRLAFIINIMHPILILNMLVLGAISAIGLVHWRKLRLTRVEIGLLLCLVLVALCTNYDGRALADIIVDAVRPLLFMATVITLRSLLDVSAFTASIPVRRVLASTIWVTIGAVILCYGVDAVYRPLYPAYSTIDAVLGLGWLMATTTFTAPLAFWVVLFLSGKRMVYIAGLVVLLLVYRQNKRALCAILLVASAAVAGSNYLGPDDVSFITKTADSHFSPEISSGGRLDEIRDAWAAVSQPLSFVVGEGFGFSYYSEAFAQQSMDNHRNVHFTPLSIFIYYGGIFFLLACCALLPVIRLAWRYAQDKTNPVLFSYSVFFLASLIFCLTEYSIFVYANFAIACGIILAAAREKQSVPPADKTV